MNPACFMKMMFVSLLKTAVQACSYDLASVTSYTLWCCRYVIPLLVAATFTGALKSILALRQYSAVVTPASGVLLLSGGTYALFSRLLP